MDFDGDSYKIFLSSDELKCFRCGEIGHISAKCETVRPIETEPSINEITATSSLSPTVTHDINNPSKLTADPTHSTANQQPKISLVNESFSTPINTLLQIPANPSTDPTPREETADRSESVSSPLQSLHPAAEESSVTPSPSSQQHGKLKNSKRTKSNTVDIEEAREFITSQSASYPLTFDELSSFINIALIERNLSSVITHFTNDISGTIRMLNDTYQIISDRSTK